MDLIKIKYKDTAALVYCHIVAWHPKLIDILAWLSGHYDKLIITEGWRAKPKWKQSDIHCTDPLRAFDLRSWAFQDPEKVERAINKVWQYDPARPKKNVAFLHDAGSGMHFHIQVHPNTRHRVLGI